MSSHALAEGLSSGALRGFIAQYESYVKAMESGFGNSVFSPSPFDHILHDEA